MRLVRTLACSALFASSFSLAQPAPLQQAAEAGDAQAQLELGILLYTGDAQGMSMKRGAINAMTSAR